MKYIVINGVKYKVDPNDESKALLDGNGYPIPYVEEPKEEEEPKDESLEELASKNPAIAKMLEDKKRLEEEKVAAEAKAEQERQDKLRQNGEFEKLAAEEKAKREEAERRANEANAVLGSYKESVKGLVTEMIQQIPEEKRSLIPEGSLHKKLDYIRKNSKFLGVSILESKGADVPPNEDKPPLDEEGKLQKEFSDLLAKENMTLSEQNRMADLSKLLKAIRARKQ